MNPTTAGAHHLMGSRQQGKAPLGRAPEIHESYNREKCPEDEVDRTKVLKELY